MPSWSRLLLASAALAGASCEQVPPPPGELIGRFAFRADLVADEEDAGRCRFAGAPASLAFEAVLSFEPGETTADGNVPFYLQIEERLRNGELAGAAFSARSPSPTPTDPEPSVGRTLRACTCDLRFVEWIEGELIRAIPGSCAAAALVPADLCPGARGCTEPALGEDGGLDPAAVGGICGIVREVVTPSAAGLDPSAAGPCTCEVDGVAEPFEQPCTFTYRLEGRRG